MRTGAYRAQASRRAYIPKADGKLRPLGIAALEDKVVQQAVVKVLSTIYAGDFLGFSYGFRAGRSQHDALPTVGKWLGSVVRGYFNYFAVPGNIYRLTSFQKEICRTWRRMLHRRSQRHRLS